MHLSHVDKTVVIIDYLWFRIRSPPFHSSFFPSSRGSVYATAASNANRGRA